MSKGMEEAGRAALAVLLSTCEEFPGLVNHEDDVDGADLVDWLTSSIHSLPRLKKLLAGISAITKGTSVMLTIGAMKEKNREAGQHFFDKETMRFFGSKIESQIISGRYFITSENNFDGSKRLYTVRVAENDGAKIGTFSTFQTIHEHDRGARMAAGNAGRGHRGRGARAWKRLSARS